VLLGYATRLSDYFMLGSKRYLATVELGVETDTYDRDGAVLSEGDASGLTRAQVEDALLPFVGSYEQVPPLYSAIKREGQPLVKAARRGQDVEPPAPRAVTVDSIDIVSYEPPFVVLEVECAKGFYVRSLAHDLGAALGVGGTLAALRRTRVGAFRIEDAVDIDTLRADLEADNWRRHLLPSDEVLLDWRAAILSPDSETRLRNGQQLTLAGSASTERCRAYSADGRFLAVMRAEGTDLWHADKVFAHD